MKLDFNHGSSEAVFFDLETQSAADLRAVGGRRYAADPTTRVLSLVCLIDDVMHVWINPAAWAGDPAILGDLWPEGFEVGPFDVRVWNGLTLPPPVAAAALAGRVFVAHNGCEFDFHVWREKLSPPPARVYDTIHGARAGGLTGGLNDLGRFLMGRGKDAAGKQLMSRLCFVQPDGRYPVILPGFLREFMRYNVADVLLLERVYAEVQDFGEADTIEAHCAVNDRGVYFDVPLARQIVGHSTTAVERSGSEIERITRGGLKRGDIRSGPKTRAWLELRGVRLKNLRKETVHNFLTDPADSDDATVLGNVNPVIFPVLRLRQAALRITGPKLDRAVNVVGADSRLRDLFVYHGAHTGRWTSKGVQVHNLTRGLDELRMKGVLRAMEKGTFTYETLEKVTLAAERQEKRHVAPDDVLSTLIRPTLRAAPGHTLAICDYAGVEARGIAWVAGDTDALKVFIDGRDPYCEIATRVYGRPITKADKTERQVGKIIALGSGYGMGAPKFALYAASAGVDLAAAGVTAEQCVTAYRTAHPRIVEVWRAYNDAAFMAVDSGVHAAGKCAFERQGHDLICTLPSGRPLRYRRAMSVPRVPSWGGPPRPTLIYHSPRGERTLYGGKLAENVVQALCRDFLATALVRCGRAGLSVVMHVHDELVIECGDDRAAVALHELARIMSDSPVWAGGFPLKVEGFVSHRYVKTAPKGASAVAYLNGREIE